MKPLDTPTNTLSLLQKASIQRFVGLDLAPNDQLESGLCVMNVSRQLIRLDKFHKDTQIMEAIAGLGDPKSLILVIDLAKNLTLNSKFRHEELKLHATLDAKDSEALFDQRYAERALYLFDIFNEAGITTFLTLSHLNRLNYGIFIPYRARSPQGCKALQLVLSHQFHLKGLPTNLLPISILEAAIASYVGLSLFEEPETCQLYQVKNQYPVLIGKQYLLKPQTKARRYLLRRRLVPGRKSALLP